ncbi:MAG: hypothetical protein ACQXXE_08825, partial [Candidatus Bathyarchaeia archaeon]
MSKILKNTGTWKILQQVFAGLMGLSMGTTDFLHSNIVMYICQYSLYLFGLGGEPTLPATSGYFSLIWGSVNTI